MITEADRRDDNQKPAEEKQKSKRERRKDERKRLGMRQCEVCGHPALDHDPMRHTADKFCHSCTDVCAVN